MASRAAAMASAAASRTGPVTAPFSSVVRVEPYSASICSTATPAAASSSRSRSSPLSAASPAAFTLASSESSVSAATGTARSQHPTAASWSSCRAPSEAPSTPTASVARRWRSCRASCSSARSTSSPPLTGPPEGLASIRTCAVPLTWPIASPTSTVLRDVGLTSRSSTLSRPSTENDSRARLTLPAPGRAMVLLGIGPPACSSLPPGATTSTSHLAPKVP
mmetsp:Transcript_27795/g.94872  ORF Transcript_27795/g.94872 Transcript_27795/m.94872 type:complete len:221 (-) Transcript_27795:847-1509(-)